MLDSDGMFGKREFNLKVQLSLVGHRACCGSNVAYLTAKQEKHR